MPSQWSIRILDRPRGGVVFWPWLPGAKPGDPLFAKQNDRGDLEQYVGRRSHAGARSIRP